jgi:hypothetical protein
MEVRVLSSALPLFSKSYEMLVAEFFFRSVARATLERHLRLELSPKISSLSAIYFDQSSGSSKWIWYYSG